MNYSSYFYTCYYAHQIQRGQLEKILKENVLMERELKKSIPALRAQIANLDYDLVMGEVEAQKAGSPAKVASISKKASEETDSEVTDEPFDPIAAIKKFFKL